MTATPTCLLRLGHARADVTPPVGIYHGFWGASKHDRATGVHRPLYADVLALAPLSGGGQTMVRVALDLCGLVGRQHEDMQQAVGTACHLPATDVVITSSHTHSSGWLAPDRLGLPGGELIQPYLQSLREKVQAAAREAMAGMREVTISYASGRCSMAANRDYWDDLNERYACGYNPDEPADDTLIVGRVTDSAGQQVAIVINYACHPTTLGYQNTLLSTDFVGAAREVVERATGAPCIYLQGPCGDLGPRDGFVGDTAVADRNGRQVGWAALSALESLGPAATDLCYQGLVVSGATLGIWAHTPQGEARREQAARFAGGTGRVDLPLKPRPDRATLERELAEWRARQRVAEEKGDAVGARDAGAYAERALRWLARIDDVPGEVSYALRYSVYHLGDSLWVTTGGEPFSLLQRELRRRFPRHTVLVSPLDGDMQAAYILEASCYGRGLYQEEPASLAGGSLEMLIEIIGARMAELVNR